MDYHFWNTWHRWKWWEQVRNWNEIYGRYDWENSKQRYARAWVPHHREHPLRSVSNRRIDRKRRAINCEPLYEVILTEQSYSCRYQQRDWLIQHGVVEVDFTGERRHEKISIHRSTKCQFEPKIDYSKAENHGTSKWEHSRGREAAIRFGIRPKRCGLEWFRLTLRWNGLEYGRKLGR